MDPRCPKWQTRSAWPDQDRSSMASSTLSVCTLPSALHMLRILCRKSEPQASPSVKGVIPLRLTLDSRSRTTGFSPAFSKTQETVTA